MIDGHCITELNSTCLDFQKTVEVKCHYPKLRRAGLQKYSIIRGCPYASMAKKPWGSNNYSDYEVWQMEEDDTEVLTPEEQQKTLKDIPKEQQKKDENEKD